VSKDPPKSKLGTTTSDGSATNKLPSISFALPLDSVEYGSDGSSRVERDRGTSAWAKNWDSLNGSKYSESSEPSSDPKSGTRWVIGRAVAMARLFDGGGAVAAAAAALAEATAPEAAEE